MTDGIKALVDAPDRYYDVIPNDEPVETRTGEEIKEDMKAKIRKVVES